EDLDGRPPLPGADVQSPFLRHAEAQEIREVLSDLAPMQRAAVVMRDLEGLSYREIGASLEVSESHVKTLVFRGRRRFRSLWLSRLSSVFIPAGLLQRARQSLEQFKEQVVAPAGKTLHACTGTVSSGSWLPSFMQPTAPAWQQCGQLLGERAGAVVVALTVTTAAGAIAIGRDVADEAPSRPPGAEVVQRVIGSDGVASENQGAGKAQRPMSPGRGVGRDRQTEGLRGTESQAGGPGSSSGAPSGGSYYSPPPVPSSPSPTGGRGGTDYAQSPYAGVPSPSVVPPPPPGSDATPAPQTTTSSEPSPDPDPTPQDEASPAPESDPSPSPDVSPTPSAEGSPSPEPTPDPSPSPTPSETPSPSPTT
ncbi:MAG TPA: sigma factor-like helix-turn-helix DNA-binding protein, partial [Actinomycetota bacterium]|nr:sigma factor-like helix-turn-helix DNA-binding protein [Actinomycetota bacterium]